MAGANPLIDLLGLLVPIETGPFHARAAAVVRELNAMPQKRRTDPAPTILGQDEYVFEVERRSRAERRVALEENGVADRRRLVLPEGKPCFEARTLTEAIFDQPPLLFGIRWRQLLELREGGDQLDQSGRIGAEGAPEDERVRRRSGRDFSRHALFYSKGTFAQPILRSALYHPFRRPS